MYILVSKIFFLIEALFHSKPTSSRKNDIPECQLETVKNIHGGGVVIMKRPYNSNIEKRKEKLCEFEFYGNVGGILNERDSVKCYIGPCIVALVLLFGKITMFFMPHQCKKDLYACTRSI